jgi:hypothetical protein
VRRRGGRPGEGRWIPLFNGKDLEGWTPKITGYEAGENYGDTFRVEDGVLKVSYDKYTSSAAGSGTCSRRTNTRTTDSAPSTGSWARSARAVRRGPSATAAS